MITNLNPSAAIFLANTDRLEASLSEVTGEISSGRRVNVASDDPNQIEALLQLRTDEKQNTQIEANLTQASAEADSADSSLSAAIQLMDTALSLATQGATATTTAQGRQSIAQQIEGIQQQMVSYSQTQVQGRYIFSGDQDGSPSYQLDLTATTGTAATTGVDLLLKSTATRQIQDPSGGTFTASETAQQIFDAPGASVFAALNSLRLSLLANDQTGIGSSITSLQTASAHLNTMEAFYGNVEDRITNANNFGSQYDTQLQREIGDIQDADVAQAATELTQDNTALQAAFQAEGKMPTTSLFNFLG
jgi:flagellar hook-associated protein 3 FlgL